MANNVMITIESDELYEILLEESENNPSVYVGGIINKMLQRFSESRLKNQLEYLTKAEQIEVLNKIKLMKAKKIM